MSDLDAFRCDGCGQQRAGSPVAYWSTMSFFEHATGGGPRKISVEVEDGDVAVRQQIDPPNALIPHRRSIA